MKTLASNTFVVKHFLPLATPGLASIGVGALATVRGTYDVIEVVAIILGLLVVAVAGVFTIRSNVAKIWREQAEGEKAKNADLTEQIATTLKEHAAEVAESLRQHTEDIASLRHELELERDSKERALADLIDANKRTDLTPVLQSLGQLSSQLSVLAGVLASPLGQGQ